jgi:hypothetical protein
MVDCPREELDVMLGRANATISPAEKIARIFF